MAAVTITYGYVTTHINVEKQPGALDIKPRFKVGYVTLPATADDGDTVTIDIFQKFGMTRMFFVIGFIHTTANSVVVLENPTTVMQGTALTLTVGGGTDNKKRFYAIYGC